MRATNSKFNALKITLMALVVVMSVSVGVFGQGRGRGRDRDTWGDRGRGGDHGLGKKCGKFVNCHDARDGRWDGRGPRRGFGDDRHFRRNRRVRSFSQDDWRRHRHGRNITRTSVFRNGRG
jgi:hypothetical protein